MSSTDDNVETKKDTIKQQQLTSRCGVKNDSNDEIVDECLDNNVIDDENDVNFNNKVDDNDDNDDDDDDDDFFGLGSTKTVETASSTIVASRPTIPLSHNIESKKPSKISSSTIIDTIVDNEPRITKRRITSTNTAYVIRDGILPGTISSSTTSIHTAPNLINHTSTSTVATNAAAAAAAAATGAAPAARAALVAAAADGRVQTIDQRSIQVDDETKRTLRETGAGIVDTTVSASVWRGTNSLSRLAQLAERHGDNAELQAANRAGARKRRRERYGF